MYNPYLKINMRDIDGVDSTERQIIFNSGVLLLLSIVVIDPNMILQRVNNSSKSE